MSVKKYEIEFQGDISIATVEIDEEVASPYIKMMVEFWAGWEQNLKACKGDYTLLWLKKLGHHIVACGDAPDPEDEGWFPIDGKHGIVIIGTPSFDVELEDITVSSS